MKVRISIIGAFLLIFLINASSSETPSKITAFSHSSFGSKIKPLPTPDYSRPQVSYRPKKPEHVPTSYKKPVKDYKVPTKTPVYKPQPPKVYKPQPPKVYKPQPPKVYKPQPPKAYKPQPPKVYKPQAPVIYQPPVISYVEPAPQPYHPPAPIPYIEVPKPNRLKSAITSILNKPLQILRNVKNPFRFKLPRLPRTDIHSEQAPVGVVPQGLPEYIPVPLSMKVVPDTLQIPYGQKKTN